VIEEVLFYPGYNVTTYEAEIYAMRNWLNNRLTWIDENIPKIYHPVKLVEPVIVNEIGVYGFDVFPNPYVDELRLSLYLEESRNVKIEIINLSGQLQYMVNEEVDAGNYEVNLTNQTTSSLKSGMYIVRLYLDNIPVGAQKIVKN